jgi:UDP-2,4-diacetamido-2,4,6-trideoxy-beta-L-altropyranose hydrolase
MMRVAVRTDATRRIGWGHLKRCLALAQALRENGAEVAFVTRPGDVDSGALIAQAGFFALPMPRWEDHPASPDDPDDAPPPHGAWLARRWDRDAADTTAAVHAWQPQVVLVDHYGIDARWHCAVRTATGARIAVIDDLADRPLAADLLIDHNPSPDHAAKYRAVLRYAAPICGGPAHALLDAAFSAQDHCRIEPVLQSIGIFMGGTDPDNFSAFAVRACREHAGWTGPIQVATTSAHPALATLRTLQVSDPQLDIVVDQPNLAAFHAAHGLQIGAGGGAMWERCSLGTPTIALITADNQRQSIPLVAAAGAVLGLDAMGQGDALCRELGVLIRRLIDSRAERQALHARALALVDGRGAERVATAVLACGRHAAAREPEAAWLP